jgi:hypothetical protein
MNTEEDEFRRIEREAKRRAARDDDDDLTSHAVLRQRQRDREDPPRTYLRPAMCELDVNVPR